MAIIPFLKKIVRPGFSFNFLAQKPSRVAGIDIGVSSTKVVQLRYEGERAILETYGELLNEGYLKNVEGWKSGSLRYLDSDIVALLKDVFKESNVTTQEVVFSVPATASFVTTISLPRMVRKELEDAIPYEARKYVPIPIAEVVLDWDILETEENKNTVDVLLVAVPHDVIEKFRRIAEGAELHLRALEVETFSLVRSLVRQDVVPTAIINFGMQSTTLAIVDRGKIRVSHNFAHGSQEITRALEKGLGINWERAEALKHDVGLSERIEEREITTVISPLIDANLLEVERFLSQYHRRSLRHIQKINVTGGGSNLKGLVERVAARFGTEVTRGDPFARITYPAFMQPMLKGIGPSFSVAVGLALHEIAS